ncbi:MAG: hypothetical protein QGH58_00455 [Arenicellales bacterium]|jgi:hypothetical protein|nr:hypothetical protein [Arenicellales bacterium]|tara:strand:- start:55945 stop:56805 length:861 start_codon:yes stop_codon:yes gene_type:complete
MTIPAMSAKGFTVIQCSGVDADLFLQNQFTCDISRIDQGDWGLAGYCSPKGRLLAIFFVLRHADAFMLATHGSLAEEVIAGLRRYILRADVTLQSCPEKGLFFVDQTGGTSAATAPQDNSDEIHRAVTLSIAPKVPQHDTQGEDPFARLCILRGIPILSAALSNTLIPQSVNLDLVGGVSFQKGCYPGQEVVARVRYRGKPKQRMICARVATSERIPVAAEIECLDQSGGRNGTVVSAVADSEPDQTLLLASVPAAALKNGGHTAFRIAGAPLRIRPLPYSLSLET